MPLLKGRPRKMSRGGNPYSKMEESKRPNMSDGGDVKKKKKEPERPQDVDPESAYQARLKGVHKQSGTGGTWGHSDAGSDIRAGEGVPKKTRIAEAKRQHERVLGELKSMKKPNLLAKGGMLTDDNYQSECDAKCTQPCEIHEQASGYEDETAPDRMPNEHGLTEMGEQSESHEEDMLRKVLSKRKMAMGGKCYSQGGKVANKQGPGVDALPNEFDDLALRDNLESSYTGANSGDEDGDSSLFEDAVSKVMLKRRKQHNPNPA